MTKKLASLAIITICYTILNAIGFENSRRQLRIINGTDTFDYPFVVALLQNPQLLRFCTGSLISSSWVITAAHCSKHRKPSDVKIRFGDVTKPANETDQLRNVLRMYRHMSYINHANDLSLMKIQRLGSIKPVIISAIDYASLVGKRTRSVGGGRTIPDNMVFMQQHFNKSSLEQARYRDNRRPLQTMEGVVVKCRSSYNAVPSNTFGFLCLRPFCSQGQRITYGDSGGPLLYKGKLIGVASSGVRYQNVYTYTAVSPFIDWIHSIATK